MLEPAFEALKSYDYGTDRNALKPIDEAVVATHGDAGARSTLEAQLAAVLGTAVSRDAKDFVCRALRTIGTAASVPALAALLPDKENSHMARYALERIPAPEAGQALRDSLAKVSDELKVGVIGSLGVRQDAQSVELMSSLLGGSNAAIARSAAIALGDIRSLAAAEALAKVKPQAPEVKSAATDATLACAEAILTEGKKAEALAIYKRVAAEEQPKHVRLAATRGMLACAGS